jgi:hypothetical protein
MSATADDVRREIGDERLIELLDYWDAKRGTHDVPSRLDIDPLELPRQLANIFFVEIEEAPRRYRYRMVGSALTEIVKEDVAGRYVDEMPELWQKTAIPPYAEAVATRRPHFREVNIVRLLWRARYLRLLLPLGEPGKPIDNLLACIYRLE